MLFSTVAITIAVTLSVWTTPLPVHAVGLIGKYGTWRDTSAQAIYRGYDPTPYKCAGALMSPSDLGKLFWVRRVPAGDTKWDTLQTTSDWFGPCLASDSSARVDFVNNVWGQHKIAELDNRVANALGGWINDTWFWGEVFVGPCPPPNDSRAVPYFPGEEPDRSMLDWNDPSAEVGYSRETGWPKQKWPVSCNQTADKATAASLDTKSAYAYTAYPIDASIGNISLPVASADFKNLDVWFISKPVTPTCTLPVQTRRVLNLAQLSDMVGLFSKEPPSMCLLPKPVKNENKIQTGSHTFMSVSAYKR